MICQEPLMPSGRWTSDMLAILMVVGVFVVLLVLRSVSAAVEYAYTGHEWVPDQRWEEGLASKLEERKGPAAYTLPQLSS
jgi:hypothetical protein